jgi:hypothetical protein
MVNRLVVDEHGSPGLIPVQSVVDLWWISLSVMNPPTLHIHIFIYLPRSIALPLDMNEMNEQTSGGAGCLTVRHVVPRNGTLMYYVLHSIQQYSTHLF